MKTLTKEQALLAEQNHQLVIDFLKYRNLSFDDYYDIVIFGFLNAVCKYCDHPELHQYKFITIAFRAMNSSLKKHFKSLNAQKNRAVVLSLDAQDSSGPTLEEMIALCECTEQAVICKEERGNLLGCFDSEDRQILSLLMDGFCEKEIAENTGISSKTILFRVNEIRTRAQEFMFLQTA